MIIHYKNSNSIHKFVFADGIANLGREEPSSQSKIPIYCINGGGGNEHNHDFLKYLSEKSGGKYFDASNKGILEDIRSQIGRSVFRFLSADFNAKDISIISPTRLVLLTCC